MQMVIPISPVTKKNSQQIVRAGRRLIVVPSAAYKKYENMCKAFIRPLDRPIDSPVNVECVYYMPTRRKVDLVNLQEATLDVLVKHGVLADDNSKIVVSMDGSRVYYDKHNPRTEICIESVQGGNKA